MASLKLSSMYMQLIDTDMVEIFFSHYKFTNY